MRASPVPADDPRLLRLLQLYIHEWSARLSIPIGPDALFSYPALERWAGDDHDAVLFFDEERPAGFALACRDQGGVWHVEEFFVLASGRRRGKGREAFALLAARHPGPWALTVRPENPEALAFWRRVLGPIDLPEPGSDGITRQRFSFDLRPPAPVEPPV